jgi:hypothetical protein
MRSGNRHSSQAPLALPIGYIFGTDRVHLWGAPFPVRTDNRRGRTRRWRVAADARGGDRRVKPDEPGRNFGTPDDSRADSGTTADAPVVAVGVS